MWQWRQVCLSVCLCVWVAGQGPRRPPSRPRAGQPARQAGSQKGENERTNEKDEPRQWKCEGVHDSSRPPLLLITFHSNALGPSPVPRTRNSLNSELPCHAHAQLTVSLPPSPAVPPSSHRASPLSSFALSSFFFLPTPLPVNWSAWRPSFSLEAIAGTQGICHGVCLHYLS